MVLSGSYTNNHFADSVNTGGGNHTSPAGVWMSLYNSPATVGGIFPTTAEEFGEMYGDFDTAFDQELAIGITCVECFFYLDTYSTVNPDWGDNSNLESYLFEFRSVLASSGWGKNRRNMMGRFKIDPNNANNINLEIYLRVGSPSSADSNSTQTNTFTFVNVQNYLNLNQWYHLIMRVDYTDPDANGVEVLIGNTGKTKTGASSGVSESDTASLTTVPSEINEGSYLRESIAFNDNEFTPFTIFIGRQNQTIDNSGHRVAIGTQALSNSDSNIDRKYARSFIGGLAEFRFWKSGLTNVKSHFELQNSKFIPVVYSSTGDYPDLVHCLRLNESSPSQGSDFIDVGQYNMSFAGDTYVGNIDSEAGYPYDIASFSGDPPSPKYFSGHAAGHAEGIDFFGQQFATGIGGVPYYREALPAELGAVPPPAGFDQLAENNTPVRIAIRDYYNGLVYLLPGTGTVQDDVPDDIDESLGLAGIGLFVRTDVFYPLTGKDVVYSQFYLIENASLIEGLDNINYYASSISGPSIIVVNDSGVGFITESEALGG